MPKFLIPLILLVLVAVGGYFGYQNIYLAPEKVIARASEQADKLKSVQADIDAKINVTATVQGVSQSAKTKIMGTTEVNIKENSQKAKFTFSMQGISTEIEGIILSDGTTYLKMPNFEGKWLSLSKETAKKAQGLPFDEKSSDYVSQLFGVVKSIKKDTLKKVAEEKVNEVRTTKYEADIDSKQYSDYLAKAGNKQEGTDFSDATMKANIWIDTKTNNVIKTETTVKGMKVQTGVADVPEASADMEFTITLSRHNQEMKISAPEGETVKYEDFGQ